MIEFGLNNKSYRIKDGFVVNEVASEELDSATVVIPFHEKINIKPFDRAFIRIDNVKTYSLVVDTYEENVCTFDTNLFDYTVHLISETALFDKVRLPNRKFTPRANRTVYWQCEQLLKYMKKIIPAYSFTERFKTKFNAIVGVEKQFNKPTLREALNELTRIANCIIKVSHYNIDYMELDKVGNEIDTTKAFMIEDSQNANDYASSIRVDAENVQSDYNNVYREFLTLTSVNSFLLSTDNWLLRTQHPIDEVVSLTALVNARLNGTTKVLRKIDISSAVVEKAVYDYYKVSSLSSSESEKKQEKIYHLYYTRGSNNVEGLTYNEKTLGLFDGKTALIVIIKKYLKEQYPNETLSWETPQNTKFEIVYRSTEKVSFTKDKDGELNNYAQITDNQQDNFINLDLFGKTEQEKVNRLGNKYKIMTAQYNSINEAPELFDRIGKFILANRELSVHSDYVLFKGILYENYTQESMFYGVNAKRRSYAIESGDKCVTRSEVFNTNLTFSTEDRWVANSIERHLLMPICCNGLEYNQILYCRTRKPTFVRGSAVSGNKNNGIFYLSPFTGVCDKSLIINFKFYDNYSVGMYNTGVGDIGGRILDYCKYVDEFGECESIQLSLYDGNYIRMSDEGTYAQAVEKLPKLEVNAEQYFCRPNYLMDRQTLFFNKDSQEILDINLQYNIKADDNIIITDRFIKLMFGSYLMKREDDYLKTNLVIAYSTNSTYTKDDDKVTADSIIVTDKTILGIDNSELVAYLNVGSVFNSIKLYNNGSINTTLWKSWALCDEQGNLYMAVNNVNGRISTTVYLNNKEE